MMATPREGVVALEALVDDLCDPSKAREAEGQCTELVGTGGAVGSLVSIILARLEEKAGSGHLGAGARRAMARLLAEAARAQGDALTPSLPRILAVSARALGDSEVSVREAFADALAAAAAHGAAHATGKEVHGSLVSPLLRALDAPSRPQQEGAARALREVLRALRPPQLRPSLRQLTASLHRRLSHAHSHGRPALLECWTLLLGPEHADGLGLPALLALGPLALAASRAADWRERLASVGTLRALTIEGPLSAPGAPAGYLALREQLESALETLRFDKVRARDDSPSPIPTWQVSQPW